MQNTGGAWGSATDDVRAAMQAYTQGTPNYNKTIEYLKSAIQKNPSLREKLESDIRMAAREHEAIRERFGETENIRPDEIIKRTDQDEYQNPLRALSSALFENSASGYLLEKIGVPEKIDVGITPDIKTPSTVFLDIMSNRDVLGSSLDTLALAGGGAAAGKFLKLAKKASEFGPIAKRGTAIAEKIAETEKQIEALKSLKTISKKPTRVPLDFTQLYESATHSGLGKDIGGWFLKLKP